MSALRPAAVGVEGLETWAWSGRGVPMPEEGLVRIALPQLNEKVAVWQGDIAALRVDCVLSFLGPSASSQRVLACLEDGAVVNPEPCSPVAHRLASPPTLHASSVVQLSTPDVSNHNLDALSPVPSALRRQLREEIEAGLRLARAQGHKTIALTPAHTDLFASRPSGVAHVLVNTLRQFVFRESASITRVVLVCDDASDRAMYRRVLPHYFPHKPGATAPSPPSVGVAEPTQPQPQPQSQPQRQTSGEREEGVKSNPAREVEAPPQEGAEEGAQEGRDPQHGKGEGGKAQEQPLEEQAGDGGKGSPAPQHKNGESDAHEEEAVSQPGDEHRDDLNHHKHNKRARKGPKKDAQVVRVVPFVHVRMQPSKNRKILSPTGPDAYEHLYRAASDINTEAVVTRHVLRKLTEAQDGKPSVVLLQAKRPAPNAPPVNWQLLFLYVIRRMHTLVHTERYELVYIPHPSLDDCQPPVSLVRDLGACLPAPYLSSLVRVRVWRPPLWLRMLAWRLRGSMPKLLWGAIEYVDSVPELDAPPAAPPTPQQEGDGPKGDGEGEERGEGEQDRNGDGNENGKVEGRESGGGEGEEGERGGRSRVPVIPPLNTAPLGDGRKKEPLTPAMQAGLAAQRGPSPKKPLGIGPVSVRVKPKPSAQSLAHAHQEIEQQLLLLDRQLSAREKHSADGSASERSHGAFFDGGDLSARSFGNEEWDEASGLTPRDAARQVGESETIRRQLVDDAAQRTAVNAMLRQERSLLLHVLSHVAQGRPFDDAEVLTSLSQLLPPDKSTKADEAALTELKHLLRSVRLQILAVEEGYASQAATLAKMGAMEGELRRVQAERDDARRGAHDAERRAVAAENELAEVRQALQREQARARSDRPPAAYMEQAAAAPEAQQVPRNGSQPANANNPEQARHAAPAAEGNMHDEHGNNPQDGKAQGQGQGHGDGEAKGSEGHAIERGEEEEEGKGTVSDKDADAMGAQEGNEGEKGAQEAGGEEEGEVGDEAKEDEGDEGEGEVGNDGEEGGVQGRDGGKEGDEDGGRGNEDGAKVAPVASQQGDGSAKAGGEQQAGTKHNKAKKKGKGKKKK